MRSADQIKRKTNELLRRKADLEQRLQETADEQVQAAIRTQIEALADSIVLLEWVLDAPTGSYHG